MASDDMPPPEPLATIVRQRNEARRLLADMLSAFWLDTSGKQYAYFGQEIHDRIERCLGLKRKKSGSDAAPPS